MCVCVVYVRSTVVYRTSRQVPTPGGRPTLHPSKFLVQKRKRVTLCRYEAYACVYVCTCACYVHNVAAVRSTYCCYCYSYYTLLALLLLLLLLLVIAVVVGSGVGVGVGGGGTDHAGMYVPPPPSSTEAVRACERAFGNN